MSGSEIEETLPNGEGNPPNPNSTLAQDQKEKIKDPFEVAVHNPSADPSLAELVPAVLGKVLASVAAVDKDPRERLENDVMLNDGMKPRVQATLVNGSATSQSLATDSDKQPANDTSHTSLVSYEQLAQTLRPEVVKEIRAEASKLSDKSTAVEIENVVRQIFTKLRVEGFPLNIKNGQLAAGDAIDGILGREIAPEVAGSILAGLTIESKKAHEKGKTLEVGPGLQRTALLQQILPHFEEYGHVRGIMTAMGESSLAIEALDQEFVKYMQNIVGELQTDEVLAAKLDQAALLAQTTAMHLYEKISEGRLKGEDVSRYKQSRDYFELEVVSKLVNKHLARGDLDSAAAQFERFLTLEDRGEQVRTTAVVGLADLYKERGFAFDQGSKERQQWVNRAAELYDNARKHGGELVTFKLAALRMENGEFSRAADLYRKVMLDTSSSELEQMARLGLGASLVEAGQHEEAVELLTPILLKDPENELALACRERAYLHIAVKSVREKDPTVSDKLVERVLAGDSSSPEAQVLRYRAALLESVAHVEALQDEFRTSKEAKQETLWQGSKKNAQSTQASADKIGASWDPAFRLASMGTRSTAEAEAQSHRDEATRQRQVLSSMRRARGESVELLNEAKERGDEAMSLLASGNLSGAFEYFNRSQELAQEAADKLAGHRVLIISEEHAEAMENARAGYIAAINRINTYESIARGVRNACVITAATLATGGIASAGGGMILSFVGGTAVGGTVGAISNSGEATGHILYGNKTVSDALSDAAKQTLADVKNSAISAMSTAPAIGIAAKLMPAAGTPVSLLRSTVVGAVSGGTSATISTTVGTAEAYAYAWSDFSEYCAANGITDEVNKEEIWREFLQERSLTFGDVAQSYLINVGAGVVGGATGGVGNRVAAPTASMTRKVVVGAAETVAGGGVEVGAAVLRGDGMTPDQAGQAMAAVVVGNFGSRTMSSTLPPKLTEAIQITQAKIDAGVAALTGGRFGKPSVAAHIRADAPDQASGRSDVDSSTMPAQDPLEITHADLERSFQLRGGGEGDGLPLVSPSSSDNAQTAVVAETPVVHSLESAASAVNGQNVISHGAAETFTSGTAEDLTFHFEFDSPQSGTGAKASAEPQNTRALDPVTAEIKQALETGLNPRSGKPLSKQAMVAMGKELADRLATSVKVIADNLNSAPSIVRAPAEIDNHFKATVTAGTSAAEFSGSATGFEGGAGVIGGLDIGPSIAGKVVNVSEPVVSTDSVSTPHSSLLEPINSDAPIHSFEDASAPILHGSEVGEPILVGAAADTIVDGDGRMFQPADYQARVAALADELAGAKHEVAPSRGISGDVIIKAAQEFSESLRGSEVVETVQQAAERLMRTLDADQQVRLGVKPDVAEVSSYVQPARTNNAVDDSVGELAQIRDIKEQFDASLESSRGFTNEVDSAEPVVELRKHAGMSYAELRKQQQRLGGKLGRFLAAASMLMPKAAIGDAAAAASSMPKPGPTPIEHVVRDVEISARDVDGVNVARIDSEIQRLAQRAESPTVRVAPTDVTPSASRQTQVSSDSITVKAPSVVEIAPHARTSDKQPVQVSVKPSSMRHAYVATKEAERHHEQIQQEVQMQRVVQQQQQQQEQVVSKTQTQPEGAANTKRALVDTPVVYPRRVPPSPNNTEKIAEPKNERSQALVNNRTAMMPEEMEIEGGPQDRGRRIRSKHIFDFFDEDVKDLEWDESKDA